MLSGKSRGYRECLCNRRNLRRDSSAAYVRKQVKSMAGRISVFVVTYNCAQYLPESLDSILRQTRPPSELIVVDDGSTDDTAQVLAAYRGRAQIYRRPHQGLAQVVRFALSLCTGDYVYKFDADDRMGVDALERLGTILDSDPNIGVAYGGISYIDASGDPLALPPVTRPIGKHRQIPRLIQQNYIPAPATMWRRAAFTDTTTYPRHDFCEDWELWIRIGLRGWWFYGLDEVLAEYRRHATNATHPRHRITNGFQEVSMLTALYHEGFAMPAEIRDAFHSSLGRHLRRLGWMHLQTGDPTRARVLFQEASRWTRPGPTDLAGSVLTRLPTAYRLWHMLRYGTPVAPLES
jgi:glycosyltransferase involved in cell wall biosynthesis